MKRGIFIILLSLLILFYSCSEPVSGPFIIENKSSYTLNVRVNNDVYTLNPEEIYNTDIYYNTPDVKIIDNAKVDISYYGFSFVITDKTKTTYKILDLIPDNKKEIEKPEGASGFKYIITAVCFNNEEIALVNNTDVVCYGQLKNISIYKMYTLNGNNFKEKSNLINYSVQNNIITFN